MSDSGVLAVFERIGVAAQKAGRDPSKINLLPVSKTQSAEVIRAVWDRNPLLPKRLGENYLEEISTKKPALPGVEWHFIGRLQSRKIVEICGLVDFIHTVAREKELREIAAASHQPKIFFQVNVSGEGQKNGCNPSELVALLECATKLGLESKVAGLMALPASVENTSESALRAEFAKLRELRDYFLPKGALSMGMSGDFEMAIEEGSDWIRVGTAIFGSRG